MGNPWLVFVKAFRKKNPGMSLKDSLKKASVEYKKGKKSAPKKKFKKNEQKSKASGRCH